MRSVVMTTLVALWLAATPRLATAAQEPPAEAPRQGAVRRGERIRTDAEAPRTPRPSSDASERRGAVRAAPRRAPRTADVPAAPAATTDPRPRPSGASANAGDEADQEQRRGAVRRPPSSPRGESSGGARTRDRAVPRTSAPPRDRDGDRVYVYNNYPYRYRSYYDVYYNPWAYSGFGLGYYYSPWGPGSYSPGSYSPGSYSPGSYGYRSYGYGSGYGYGYADIGTVRLKVTPRDAEVFVDNYFAGYVDDFDGIFQSLKLEVGGHRVEIRKPGFAPLQFDVHVQPDRTVTFRGELRPLVP